MKLVALYFNLFAFITLFSFSNFALADNSPYGLVVKLKGSAKIQSKKKWKALNENDSIKKHAVIKTGKASFVSIKLKDSTIINLGPNSFMKIKTKKNQEQSFNLMFGKLRAIINKKLDKNEKMNFNSNAVALGVRGTEFLQNAYMVKGKATSDVMLLKGKLAVDAGASAPNLKPFQLEAGKSFNTNELANNGLSAIKQIPKDLLKSLSNPASFLPNLQAASGAIVPATSLLTAITGVVASGLLSSSDREEKKRASKKETDKGIDKENDKEKSKNTASKALKNSITKSQIKGLINYRYVLKNEPEDIREAIQARTQNLKKNICFYWFYKKIPGSGTKERFKRKRDCDDYDYEL